MKTYRKNAIAAGVLLLLAWIPGVAAAVLTSPLLDTADYLSKITANPNQMLIAAILLAVMALACPGIAVALYPVLKRHNPGLAVGSVAFRVMEGTLQFTALAMLVTLVPLSRVFTQADASSASTLQTIGDLLRSGSDWVSNVAVILAFNVGALMYYYILYRAKLIPRWLAGWGMLADVLAIASAVLVMAGRATGFDALQIVLNLPIGLQELVLAGWLIVKGFNRSALTDEE